MDFNVSRAIPVNNANERQPTFDASRAVPVQSEGTSKNPLTLGEVGDIALRNLKETPGRMLKDIGDKLTVLRWPYWRFIEHPTSTVVEALQRPEGKTVGGTLAQAAQAFVPFRKIPKEEYGSYGKVWDNYFQDARKLAGQPEIKTPGWYVALASYGSAMAVEPAAIKAAVNMTETALTRVATAEESAAVRAHFEPLKQSLKNRGLNTDDLHPEGNIIKIDADNEIYMNKYLSAILRGDEIRIPRWAKVNMPSKVAVPDVEPSVAPEKALTLPAPEVLPVTGPEVFLKTAPAVAGAKALEETKPLTAEQAVEQGLSAEEWVGSKEGYLYHNSSQRFFDDIKEQGLIIPEEGGYPHGIKEISDDIPRLYMAKDPKRALEFGGSVLSKYPETRSLLLRVKKNVIDGKIYESKTLAGGETWVFDKGIKPEFIEYYDNGIWKPLTGKLKGKTKPQLLSEYEKAKGTGKPEEVKRSKYELVTPKAIVSLKENLDGIKDTQEKNDIARAPATATPSNPPGKPPQIPEASPSASPEYERNRSLSKIAKGSTVKKDAKEFIDKTFVPISTRLSKIDESLKDAIRQHAFNVNMKTKEDMDTSVPFLSALPKMNKVDMVDLDFALKNGDAEVVAGIVKKYGIEKEYNQVKETLKGIHERAKKAGMDIGFIEDYFPRRITDVEAFLNFLKGKDEWGMISKAFKAEEKALGRPLQEEEKAEIVNSMVRGYGKEKIALNKPSNAKERKILKLTPEMNAFYKDSGIALSDYIRTMNDNIEARIFFGKEKNLDNSIGNYIARLIDDKIISPTEEEAVRTILKSYFEKRGTRGIITGFKNFSYIASMGSPISAITQIGDLSFSLYSNGFYGTVKAIFKKDKITKQDIGLDLIAEEFTDASKSSKAVSRVFKAIGLDAMDAFGKEVLINGAFDKLSKQALKEDPKLLSELHRVFPDRSAQVLDDMKNKVPTDDVKYMLFSRLADFQPIALTEMPEYYVKGGNMRLFYMLKSYTIKQLDVYHNEIFREKDPIKKAQNAFRLAAALMLMGVTSDTTKDLLLGRKTKLQDLVIDNMLKLVGFSKWQIYKTRMDGLFTTVLQSILPPVPFLDDLYKDAIKMTNEKKHPELKDLRIWQTIPIVGKFYYWWFGGGKNIGKKKINIGD